MKKLIISGVIALVAMTSFAQDIDNKWAVSASVGIFEYNGEFGNEAFTFQDLNLAGSVGISRYLSKFADASLNISFGAIDFDNKGRTFSSNLRNIALEGKYKLNNGDILKEDVMFKPFATIGFGVTQVVDINVESNNSFVVDNKSTENATHFYIPIGLGVSYDIDHQFSAFVSTTYNYVGTDLLDGYSVKNESDRDEFFHHAIGVTFRIGGKKDSDKDGVIDELDRCPDVVGLVKLYGCPDYDGDGVSDLDDLCPTSPGLTDMNGCPDTDGDGVSDKDDACPQVAGSKETNGCPDADADGVADHEDACMDVAGSKSAAGCPDADADGVADADDLCPTVFGAVEKSGCPLSPVNNFKTVVNINFSSNGDALTASAQKELKDIISILNVNSDLKLMIEGHTDADGEENLNKDLSEQRSAVVRDFLLKNGVSVDRLNSTQYGQAVPLVPNNTAAGKAKNRRVVVKVIN
jgi:outer membrane protein OmpA-like peptidoglycan-associated protein